MAVAEGRWRVQRLNAAREDAARRPGNFQPALDVAGHTAGLGRLRQAYTLYGEAMLLGPVDPRPRLRRGELLLQLREIAAAREELEVAARLARTGPKAELEPLPDGSVRVTSVGYRIEFGLGLADFLAGEFASARGHFETAIDEAAQPLEAATAALWHFFAGRERASAGSSFELISPEFRDAAAITPAYRVLLSVNEPGGWIPPDNARPADEIQALYWYAQGLMLLWSGQTDSARRLFRAVLRLPDWTRPAVAGAEKELERLSAHPLLPDRLGLADGEQVAVSHQGLPQ